MGVLMITALLLGVYIRAPDSWNLLPSAVENHSKSMECQKSPAHVEEVVPTCRRLEDNLHVA